MKLFILVLILGTSLFSQTFKARYHIEVGLFGAVGYSDVYIEDDGKTYKMEVTATTTGTAATLTGDRTETYISKGHIVEGRYLPDSFYKYRKTTRKIKIQTYVFDHTKKEISLTQERSKWVSETNFDPISFKLTKQDILEKSKEESILDVYTDQDIFSSYLNARNICNTENSVYKLIAVGAHNHKKSVTITYLEGEEKQTAIQELSTDITEVFHMHIQPKAKEDTVMDFYIGLGFDRHVKKAILGKVFWIGEITSTRVYDEISSK